MVESILLAAALAAGIGSGADARPAYRDSRGQRVELNPAPERSHELRAERLFALPGAKHPIGLDRGVILKLRTYAPDPVRAVLRRAGLEPVKALDKNGTLLLARAGSAEAALASTFFLWGSEEVAWAVPDFIVTAELAYRPGDPSYSQQWFHSQSSGADIHSEEAWDVTLGDGQVIAAVLDTGFEISHPDFAPERLLPGFNAIDGGNDVVPGPSAIEAHGTACSGLLLASSDNGQGGTGVCPRCSLLPVKIMDSDGVSLSTAVSALSYAADHGAWVISNSWSFSESDAAQLDLEPLWEAIRHARDQGRGGLGTVVIFSASNDGSAIGAHQIAGAPEVMAVGSSGMDDHWASFSDFGPNLSVLAPSMDQEAPGHGLFTTDTLGDRGKNRHGESFLTGSQGDYDTGLAEPDPTGDYTAYMGGTSGSAAIAAGVVALVFSANPALTGQEARRLVEGTADRVWPDEAKYDASGHSDQYGFGRINAGRAVRAAQYGFNAALGAACAEDLNCGAGSCFKAAASDPTGFCSKACSKDEDCGSTALCLPLQGQSRCQSPACGSGVVCPQGTECNSSGRCTRPILGGCGCRTGSCGPELWWLILAGLFLRRMRNR